MGERLAADLDLLALVMLPGLGKRGEARADREDHAVILDGVQAAAETLTSRVRWVSRSSARKMACAETLRRLLARPSFVKGPDAPLGGVELPRLHAVAVIVLKLVVIVVVPLAEGHQRHDPAIAGAATARVRPRAERVAGGIDAKGAMLEADHAGNAADEKPAQGADRPLVETPDGGGETEADQHGEEMDVTMLKADQDVAVEVRDVIERRLRIDLEHEPAHVRVEEALADVVRVFLVIDDTCDAGDARRTT